MQHKPVDASFLAKIREEFEIYRNFPTIAEKLDNEGNLGLLVQSLDTVFANEIGFALRGKLTRNTQNEA